MTAQERKHKTETLLRELGIPFNDHLPVVEEEDEIALRTPAEIAARILVLTYLSYVSQVDEHKQDVIDFLKREALWDSVSNLEKELFHKASLTDRERINISWRSEAIWLLLWSINKVEELDMPFDEIAVGEILDRIPDLTAPTKEFITSATIRPASEILDQSDLIYRLHWATRQAQLQGDFDLGVDLNPSIIQERHYAVNWLTGYAEDWDDVTTDT